MTREQSAERAAHPRESRRRSLSVRLGEHIRSNVVGYVAIFIALSGTAYAVDGPLPGTNQVGSEDIIDSEVNSVDIRNQGVATADVKNEDLTGTDVAPDSLTGADILESSLSIAPDAPAGPAGGDLAGYYPSPQIAPDAVAGSEVSPNSLAAADIADTSSLGTAEIDETSLFNDNSLTGTDINESTLSGLPSTPSGAAGGDLAGTYPNPTIAADAIGSGEVAADALTGSDVANTGSLGTAEINEGNLFNDSSLTGADVNESTLSGVNADTVDGLDSTQLVRGTTDVADTGECSGSLPRPSIVGGIENAPIESYETCVDTFTTLTQTGRLFVIASAGWEKASGDPAFGACIIRLDNQRLTPIMELGDNSGFGGGHTGEPHQLPFTLNTIVGPLSPGSYDIDLACLDNARQNSPAQDVDAAMMSVIVVGA